MFDPQKPGFCSPHPPKGELTEGAERKVGRPFASSTMPPVSKGYTSMPNLTAIEIICPVAFFLITLVFFYLGITRWDTALRHYIAKKFQVSIYAYGSGRWYIVSPIAWYKKCAIESLQMGLYMMMFFAWALSALGLVLLLGGP